MDATDLEELHRNLISQEVFIKSFYTSKFSHKSVDVSFNMTNIQNKLTDSRGN